MRMVRLCGLIGICLGLLVLSSGCGTELQNLKVQNDTQRVRIEQLESDVAAKDLELDQLRRQVSSAEEQKSAELEVLQTKITALEEDIAAKKALIASMQEQLLIGGGQLPVELTTKLEELATKYPMISYDAARGVLKFESDLTFEPGSDQVTASAASAVRSLCGILNSKEAEGFDVIIAGHTDDVPIGKPETRAKHPNNWYLSVHRGIGVLNIMTSSSVDPKRLSVRGFGEYRPMEPNAQDNKGNAKNRRVEIYIVPKGM